MTVIKLDVRQILAAAVGLGVVGAAGWLVACSPSARAADGFAIQSLSSQPHLVSGGDVLLRVDMPEAVSLQDVVIDLNKADVTAAFRPDPAGHALLGLVDGLRNGENVVTVSVGDGEGAGDPTTSVILTNYPASGPMISGPHEQPFVCQTHDFTLVTGEKLGPPIDENCSVETRVDYVYRSTEGVFKPIADRSAPLPADVVKTTTSDGQTVPFVVRVQTGTVNRAVYESAILHDPNQPDPDHRTRSAGWNGKLVYTHGGGCRGGWYHQGVATGGVLQDAPSSSYVREGLLEQGYALTSASLNRFSDNCNDLLASETHMMVKERFIESYGPPVYTISTGSSGGSYQSHQTADNYPGVFDGIIVGASFPDVTSATIFTLSDSRLLHYYFEHVAPGTFTKEEARAVSGFGQWGSIPNMSVGARRIDPVYEEGLELEDQGGEYIARNATDQVGGANLGPLPVAERYDPVTNPTGARATVYDHTVNVYGVDPETGFAARPLDNVGVQYGLAALNAGVITQTQFLDLNARIGGFDADANHVPGRHVANERATRVAHRSGRILNGGGGLATTPVIDYRSYTDDRVNGDIHMIVHQYTTRTRLMQANGHADNHVMEIGGRWGFAADEPDLKVLFAKMDRWLGNIAADTSDDPQAVKVVRAKPADLVDACWDTRAAPPVKVNQPQAWENSGVCHELYRAFLTSRHVAGAPLANNIVKCQLKPINWTDYGVTFTAGEQSRLQEIFADGVCDWSRPGIYQEPLQGTWLSFGPSNVNRVE